MTDHTPDWIGPALASAGAVTVGFLGWLGVRGKTKAEAPNPQAVQNEGWEKLLGQMRTELIAASRERNHLNKVLEEERRTWRGEREAWRVEREQFMGQIAQLQAVAEGFERLLRRNGIALPERKTPAVVPGLVGATLSQDPVADEE